jgi:hypothetical protein
LLRKIKPGVGSAEAPSLLGEFVSPFKSWVSWVMMEEMLRFIFPLLVVAAIPWAAITWWRMRRARSDIERNFIARTHTSIAIFAALAVMALAALGPRERLFAVPIFFVVGLGIRHGIRKGRARIQAQRGGDAFSRAKRIN